MRERWPQVVGAIAILSMVLHEIQRLAEIAVFGPCQKPIAPADERVVIVSAVGPNMVRTSTSVIGERRARPQATMSPKGRKKRRAKAWPLGRNFRLVCANWRN